MLDIEVLDNAANYYISGEWHSSFRYWAKSSDICQLSVSSHICNVPIVLFVRWCSTICCIITKALALYLQRTTEIWVQLFTVIISHWQANVHDINTAIKRSCVAFAYSTAECSSGRKDTIKTHDAIVQWIIFVCDLLDNWKNVTEDDYPSSPHDMTSGSQMDIEMIGYCTVAITDTCCNSISDAAWSWTKCKNFLFNWWVFCIRNQLSTSLMKCSYW